MPENSFLPASTDKLNEMVKTVNAMVQFVPEAENRLKSLYDYWKILNDNLARLKKGFLVEKNLAEKRISILEKSMSYAKKFRKVSPPGMENEKAIEHSRGSAGDIQILTDELETRIQFAKESLFDPLEERILQTIELIKETLELSIAEKPPLIHIEMRRLLMDKEGGLCHILTIPSMPASQYIAICYCLIERIPMEYTFFVDDVGSFESPDGMTWFYRDDKIITSDYAKSNEELEKMCRQYHESITPVKSHIPVIPPDDGPHYRIKYGAAFDSVEIFKETGYDNQLNEDELARFTGYLYSLKEAGLIDFRLKPVD